MPFAADLGKPTVPLLCGHVDRGCYHPHLHLQVNWPPGGAKICTMCQLTGNLCITNNTCEGCHAGICID
eukprot:1159400-Pelagomonas_calceolata.AAC.2